MTTTNELEKKLKKKNANFLIIYTIVIVVINLVASRAVISLYKELDDKRLKHIRSLQLEIVELETKEK